MPTRTIMICLIIGISCSGASCQLNQVDSTVDRLVNFPSKLFGRIQGKAANLEQQLTKQTQKYAEKIIRREARLKKKLTRIDCSKHRSSASDSCKCEADSTAAARLFSGNPEQRYATLLNKLKSDTAGALRAATGPYRPYTDSLQGVLTFLNKNQSLLNSSAALSGQVQGSLSQISQLQAKLQDADALQQFMQQRQTQIRQYLGQFTQIPPGVSSAFSDYNKQLYNYGQQVKAYKDILDDPDKMLNTALQILDKLPAFSSFMHSNSFLSGLLNVPGGGPMMAASGGAGVPGLQTRGQIMTAIQNQLGAGGPNPASFVQQNVNSAQCQIDQLRDKLGAMGGNGGSLDMPDFKPNSQRTKSFLHRLEFGVNLQTAHGNYYYPTTSDLGFSMGYRLNDKNSIGVGASYKIGWGSDISHAKITSEGAGLRSYLDIQIQKSFYASGGFEYNYQQPFYSTDIFHNLNSWQRSGLIGISKIISLRAKVFSKTKIQLLWDFLSYQQVPKAQPLKFRIGYNF